MLSVLRTPCTNPSPCQAATSRAVERQTPVNQSDTMSHTYGGHGLGLRVQGLYWEQWEASIGRVLVMHPAHTRSQCSLPPLLRTHCPCHPFHLPIPPLAFDHTHIGVPHPRPADYIAAPLKKTQPSPLWTGGRIDAGIELAARRPDAAQAAVEERRLEITQRVIAAYPEALRQPGRREHAEAGLGQHAPLAEMRPRRLPYWM